LDKLFRLLSTMHGAKVVVLVSEGLLMRPDLRDGSEVSLLAKRAAASGVALFSVLLNAPLMDGAEGLARERPGTRSATAAQDHAIEEDGLKAITSESGGLLFRAFGTEDDAFRRLADALSGYYIVTFRVLPLDVDGAHRIGLRTRSALDVHARTQFVISAATRRPTSSSGASSAPAGRRVDAPSMFTLDKVALQLATRSIADANGTIRILISIDVRDPANHETSALALGYKLKMGDRLVADGGRLVPVTRTSDGVARPVSYIAFQGLQPGTYELELSASDGSKHSALVKHPVSARLHPIGSYALSDLLLAASAPNADGPFPVPAHAVADHQIITGVEVSVSDRSALANAAIRFEALSSSHREGGGAQEIKLSPAGPLSQFVRATLDLTGTETGECVVRASVVVDGVVIGQIETPFQIAR
jgi:hypothetical protein